jgi:hypothetical protein
MQHQVVSPALTPFYFSHDYGDDFGGCIYVVKEDKR